MLIISFDAVGDDEFGRLITYPAVSAFAKQARVFRDVSTVFLSNTYPIHTSVATGVTPNIHGVTSNLAPFPSRCPFWNSRESNIRAKTIWQSAAEHGIDTAAVFWPVTAFSKTIRWNIPEVIARPGKSQIMTSLAAGSKRLQFKLFLRHGKLLRGIGQPALDNFATACMVDILREKKPGLALIHLTAYDTLRHRHGKNSAETTAAFEALDKNLALLLKAAGERETIIFSDHSQIDVHTVLDPNAVLVEAGLLGRGKEEYNAGESNCFIECCGGSAFFHAGTLAADKVDGLRRALSKSEGFRRFLTNDETRESGHDDAAFGFCAKAGFCFEAFAPTEKANHGYPLDMPDYKVFYMARGFGLEPGLTRGGSLLDIAPLVTEHLNNV